MSETRSPGRAPVYLLHRTAIVNDADPIMDKKLGLNCAEHGSVHLQVVPSESAAPAVEVLFWSDEAGMFISQHTALSFTAKSAGVAWETTVQAQGRIIYVSVTAGIAEGDTVKIFAARYDAE